MDYGFEILCASIFTIACIVLAGMYNVVNRLYTYWDSKKVKGPIASLRTMGTWPGFNEKFVGSEDLANTLKYGKVYGTFDGTRPNLLVTDPDLIKDIIDTTNENLQDVRYVSENSVLVKDSLLSLCGGEKSDVQILTSSLLNPHKLEKIIQKLETAVESLCQKITNERGEDGRLDMTSAITDFVHEAVAAAILGIELNADIQFKEEFVKNIQEFFKSKSQKSLFLIYSYLVQSPFADLQLDSLCPEKALQYFVNIIISEISDSSNEINTPEEMASSLIELMVEAAEEEKKLVKKEKEGETQDLVLTDNAIISKCIASMLTFLNATRTTVLMGIHSLANNEEVQEKLFREVEKNKAEKLTYEGIQNLNYLDKVVKEVLRLYPFEHRLEKITNGRVKLGDIELEEKFRIKVSIPLYALHRLEEYYPEPEKFDPERFSQSSSENRSAFTYLPFGQAGFNGSDISLQLGVLAAKVALYRLVEKFKFSEPQPTGLSKLFKPGFTRVPQPATITVLAETRI